MLGSPSVGDSQAIRRAGRCARPHPEHVPRVGRCQYGKKIRKRLDSASRMPRTPLAFGQTCTTRKYAPTSNSAATRPGSNKRFLFLPFTDVPGRNGDTLCISRSRPKQSGAPRPGGYACRAVALKQFRRSTVPIFHLRVRRDTPNRFFLVAPAPPF